MNVQELKTAWLNSIIDYDQIITECYNRYREQDAYDKNDKLLDTYAEARKTAYTAYFEAKKAIK